MTYSILALKQFKLTATSVLIEATDASVDQSPLLEKFAVLSKRSHEMPYSNKDGFLYYLFLYAGGSFYDKFTYTEIAGMAQLGGNVFGARGYVEVTPAADVPVGIKNSVLVNEDGTTRQKTWTEYAKFLGVHDEKYYFSLQDGLSGGRTDGTSTDIFDYTLDANDILILLTASFTIKTPAEYSVISNTE